jgi:hypothetical protein
LNKDDQQKHSENNLKSEEIEANSNDENQENHRMKKQTFDYYSQQCFN